MSDYFLPADYRENAFNNSRDNDEAVYWTKKRLFKSLLYQQHVYRWAGDMAAQSGAFISSVLDVGCGPALKLNRFMPERVSLTGIDQRSAVIECAKHKRYAHYIEVDLGNPTPLDKKFDMVICSDVIEHVDDPIALLDYIKAHTKPGGTLIISTPDRVALRGPLCRTSPNKDHIREWSEPEFVALLKSAGWYVAQTRHFPLAGFWPLNWLAPYLWLKQAMRGYSTRPNLCVQALLPEDEAHKALLDHLRK